MIRQLHKRRRLFFITAIFERFFLGFSNINVVFLKGKYIINIVIIKGVD